MILINQVLHYCTSSNFFFLSCSVKAFWGVSTGRVGGGGGSWLDCIREFRQGGQIVSWMATSEAVPPWGRAGRGGGALGPEDGSKSTLLFSSRREGGERQEGRWRAGASWYSGAGGHYCGRESDNQSRVRVSQVTQKCEVKEEMWGTYYRESLSGRHCWSQESQVLLDWSWEPSRSLPSSLRCRSSTAEEWRLTGNPSETNCWNFECNLEEGNEKAVSALSFNCGGGSERLNVSFSLTLAALLPDADT